MKTLSSKTFWKVISGFALAILLVNLVEHFSPNPPIIGKILRP